MTVGFRLPDLDAVVQAALAEDLGVDAALIESQVGASLLDRDVTGSLLGDEARFAGDVVARRPGVVCGLPVARAVWDTLAAAAGAESIEAFPLLAEGAHVEGGTSVLEVEGSARVVLAGERTALDFLMVLSGIATETARWVAASGGLVTVVDTRKTVPGLRALSKYAVAVGGGMNHRMGLNDMYLIKDNHVAAAGGIASAVDAAREAHPELLVEVEADGIDQAIEAARAGADLILLDNMDDATLARAVTAVHAATPAERTCLTEASGGITIERVPHLAEAGVDRVSSSALTLARPLDFGLDAR